MKCLLFTLLLILTGSLCAPGQDGFIVHLDSVQAGRNGSGISVREVPDGYLVFSRQLSQQFPGTPHIYVRKLGEDGQFIHQREYLVGDPRDFDIGYIDAVATRPDGTFAAGIAEGWWYPGETWLYVFDQNGDTLSRRFLMTFPPADSVIHAIRQTRSTSDGGSIFCGFINRPPLNSYAFLVKISPAQDTVWTRGFVQQSGSGMVALGVEEYVDSGYLLTGYRNGVAQHRSFLLRTDADGNELWRRYYGNVGSQNGAVRVAPDGGIITWSAYKEPAWSLNTQEMMLTKWNAEGQVVWQRMYLYNYLNYAFDMEVLPDGSIIATGAYLNKAVLIKFNAEGEELWSREHAVLHGQHYLYDVEPTSDGGFVCTGVAWRSQTLDPQIQQSQTIWVVKTDSLGCVVPGCQLVGVEEYLLDLNEHLRIWPNPVARGTPLQLSFTPTPEFMPNGPLRLVVLDAMGRQVHEKSIGTGTGTRQLANLPLAAGLYYLHLTDGTRWLAGGKVVVE